jgi:polyisoprenoid-binding protein YceI
MATATQPFTKTFTTDPVHSSFGFAVKHMAVSTFRGQLEDASATLTPTDAGYELVGEATVDSISIRQPDQFRAHVLSPEFFDAESHPKVTFRSTDVELTDDGKATVRGELTIRGVAAEITATGTYSAPQPDPMGNERGALELEADIDRTAFGITWNAPMPNGGNILEDDVKLYVHLELLAH